MKNIFLSIIMLASSIGAAQAIEVQKIYLKNGSVISGYIQKQSADGSFTIASDRAMICLRGADTKIYNEQEYQESSLKKEWVEWAEKEEAFVEKGDARTLKLADIEVKGGRNVSKVRILESGVSIKYLEISPNTYSVKWADVQSIRSDKRAKNALSGIDRVYQLKNGEQYEGQYAEETDSTLSLYLQDGSIRSFNIDDVVKYTYKPVNPNQDIFAQSPLLDVITTKNKAEMRGVIVEQNYVGKVSENYILLRQESGAFQSIKINDIEETRKEENKAYSPKFDIILNDGDILVNRIKAEYVKVQEENDVMRLEKLNEKVTIVKDNDAATRITVEFRDDKLGNVEKFQLVKIRKENSKKGTIYTFSYKDLVNSLVRPLSIETSVNKTTKVEYDVYNAGTYVLYNSSKKEVIPIIIKK